MYLSSTIMMSDDRFHDTAIKQLLVNFQMHHLLPSRSVTSGLTWRRFLLKIENKPVSLLRLRTEVEPIALF